MSEQRKTPAPVGTRGLEVLQPTVVGPTATSKIAPASAGTNSKCIDRVLPPFATEKWDEDMCTMVPVSSALPQELPPAAEHLRERLLQRPRHPQEPRALLSELLACHVPHDWIKQMVPEWPGLASMDVVRVDNVIRRALVFHEHEPLRRYQERYFVLKEFGGKVRLCWYDSDGNFRHRSPQSWKEAETTVKIDIDDGKGGKKKTSAADRWYNSPDRNEYETAEFRPGQHTSPDVLNLWQGWSVGILPNGTPTLPESLLWHIKENMCGGDEAVFRWFMGWMADAVQNVHRTAGTAVVLRGPEGSGKNFWADKFMELFAPHTMMLTNSKQLTGNFNSHLMDKLVVFANEAFFAGNKADAAALKALVTDSTMMVEPKGVDAFQVQKHFRLIIASNDAHVVRVSESDRRYLVLEVDAKENNNSRDYFGEIADEWTNGGREQFMTLLWHWDLSDWNEGQIPDTAARKAQRAYSLGEADQWVMELLDRGEIAAAAQDGSTGHVFLLTLDLPGKSKAYGTALRAAGAMSDRRESIGSQGQQRGYWIPDLSRARRTFAQEKGVCPEWLEETTRNQWTFIAHPSGALCESKSSPIRDLF